jgi:hypothetical protein
MVQALLDITGKEEGLLTTACTRPVQSRLKFGSGVVVVEYLAQSGTLQTRRAGEA